MDTYEEFYDDDVEYVMVDDNDGIHYYEDGIEVIVCYSDEESGA